MAFVSHIANISGRRAVPGRRTNLHQQSPRKEIVFEHRRPILNSRTQTKETFMTILERRVAQLFRAALKRCFDAPAFRADQAPVQIRSDKNGLLMYASAE